VEKVRTGVDVSRSRLKIHIGQSTLVLKTSPTMAEKYFLEVLEIEVFVKIS
tara:strand:- start:4633 stop:4785 length:153 start_codon:yes stop_codon:yes gene_type:complete